MINTDQIQLIIFLQFTLPYKSFNFLSVSPLNIYRNVCDCLSESAAHTRNQGVKNIGRWTQFCDPLKKKSGMNSLEGIS